MARFKSPGAQARHYVDQASASAMQETNVAELARTLGTLDFTVRRLEARLQQLERSAPEPTEEAAPKRPLSRHDL